MAKRRAKQSIDADAHQDELDLGPDGGDGARDGHAGVPSRAETLRLEARDDIGDDAGSEATSSARSPQFDLPSLTMNPSWDGPPEFRAAAASTMRGYRIRRLAALAATVALAAALGAVAGSIVTGGLGAALTASRPGANDASLQGAIVRIEQELAALRTSVETAAQDTQAKTTRIAERLDRSERSQAEPLAKLAKIGEAVERLERRTAQPAVAAAAVPAGDITGSLGAPRAAVPETKPPVATGWTLLEVHSGAALVEGREGLIEVLPGDTLPRLGRVEAIRKQDGRWVVVTARGLIVGR
jgi:hypothetical protein